MIAKKILTRLAKGARKAAKALRRMSTKRRPNPWPDAVEPKTLEIAFEVFAKNVPYTRRKFNRVRESVRRMNRDPKRTVNVRIMNKPGAIIEDKGQKKYLITAKGRRLPI